MKRTDSELIALALDAMKRSYSPYSGFSVGAALECADGTVYMGANIENASFTPTVCAERTAFFKAVLDGKRDFSAIAVVGGKNGKALPGISPCGVCRQVMREFCGDDFIILEYSNDGITVRTLGELLPHSFNPGNIQSAAGQF